MNNLEIQAEYQAAIDAFKAALAHIDHRYTTYVKLDYDDVRTRPLQVYGEPTKLIRYSREIEIDEIILR